MKTIFTYNSMIIDGQSYPAEYTITAPHSPAPVNSVRVFLTVEEQGYPFRMRLTFCPGDACYDAVPEAAQEADRIWNQERSAAAPAAEAPTLLTTIQQDMAMCLAPLELPAAPDPEPEALTPDETSAPAPEPEQQPRKDVPEKFFVGMEIKGRGWRIEFSGSYERTRVIFKRKPSDRALEAVKRYGFYWSPVMKSWNKELTHKAWRAAQALAMELREIGA